MASFDPTSITKPIENIHPDRNNLPEANNDDLARGLTHIVDHSADHPDVRHNIHAPLHRILELPWVQKLIPGIEKLAAEYHVGNFVAMRGSEHPFFESMPLYARIGMHLIFYGNTQTRILGTKTVEELLREQSIKQGKIYDSSASAASIPSFVAAYSIQTDELEEPDITKYSCFNNFFFRKLRPEVRPVQNGDNPRGICSAADSRLTVYSSIDLAKKFWVKGKQFDIPNLLHVSADSEKALQFHDGALAIFRLAPADYHRFHSPIDGIIEDIDWVTGNYYTVNPQAVNETGFDVFTANTRSILYMKHASTGHTVAFVAIGALLVGSINWTGGDGQGKTIKRGEELGYFAYGGSTVIVIFGKGAIEFDNDLLLNSEKPIETLMKVGYSIGKTPE